MSTCNRLVFANTRISTSYAQKPPHSLVSIIYDKTDTRITKPLNLRMRDQTRAIINLGYFPISVTMCWHTVRDRDMGYTHLLKALQHGLDWVTSTTQYHYLLLYIEHLGERNCTCNQKAFTTSRCYAPGSHSVKLEQIILDAWLKHIIMHTFRSIECIEYQIVRLIGMELKLRPISP